MHFKLIYLIILATGYFKKSVNDYSTCLILFHNVYNSTLLESMRPNDETTRNVTVDTKN